MEAEKAVVRADFDLVERNCAAVLSDEPHHHKANILLALAQANTGRLAQARETLEATLSRNPSCPVGLNWLAAVLRAQGEFDEAIRVCRRIVDMAPKDAENHNNLGLSLVAGRRFEEAAKAFAGAQRLDPNQVRYYQNLAIAHQHCSRPGEAETAYRKGLALFPDDASMNAGLGELLFLRDDCKASIPFFRRAVAGEPANENFKVSLAQAVALNDGFDEAEDLARDVLGANPNNARAHAILGSIFQHRGDFSASGEHLRKAIELDPHLVGAYFEFIYGGRFQPENRPLLESIDRLLPLPTLTDHDRLCLRYGLGKAHEDLEEYEEAFEAFKEANHIALRTRRKNKVFRAAEFERRIDRLIERFDSRHFRNTEEWLSEDTPIFIVGMMRSGSTLLEQVLSSHPQVAPGGELMFWPDVFKELPEVPEPDLLTAKEYGFDYLELLEKRAPGSPRVTDKMLDNVLHLGTLAVIFPNAKFICCRRHPVGNCLSLYTTPFRFAQPYLHDMEDIAKAHKQYSRLMDHWLKVIPSDRYAEVWYKDLVGDREATTRRLVEFCGLKWDDSCLRHEANDRIVTTASKWQARQPIYRQSLEKWHHYAPWIDPFLKLLPEEHREAA